jgi:hypothetical protein
MRLCFRTAADQQLLLAARQTRWAEAAGSSGVAAHSLIAEAGYNFVAAAEHSRIAQACRVAAEHSRVVAHKLVAGADHNQVVDHNQAA